MRCVHEASLYQANSFITLTYDDAHFPHRGMLHYPDYQKFMKRLRFHVKKPVRFYMCGEYGPTTWRPHFHACLFGYDFEDKAYWSTLPSDSKIFRSALLERLWPFGFASVGAVTFESAAYVARYCVAKVTGHNAKAHYARQDAHGAYSLPPEFNKMSLKPGIGARWLQKYETDVFPHDYVVINGKEVKPPKYYDRLYNSKSPEEFEAIQYRRETDGRSRYLDNTPERLAVKETVAIARSNLTQRIQIE